MGTTIFDIEKRKNKPTLSAKLLRFMEAVGPRLIRSVTSRSTPAGIGVRGYQCACHLLSQKNASETTRSKTQKQTHYGSGEQTSKTRTNYGLFDQIWSSP
jgi:hypothetical protein